MTKFAKYVVPAVICLASFVSSGASAALQGYSFPPLTGTYRPASGLAHPYVLTDKAALQKLLLTHTPAVSGSLATLEGLVKTYIKTPDAYTTPYSGCNLNTYLYHATFEGSFIPGGAHPAAFAVAADLAMYAYLTSLHSNYGDATLADQAKQLAKTILLKWSSEGFRDHGQVRTKGEQFCDAHNDSNSETTTAVGLQIGRGMPRWVQAQDLLMGLDAFDAAEKASLDQFLAAIYRLIETTANERAETTGLDCVVFNNHVSAQLAGMASIARLRDNADDLKRVAFGAGGGLDIPWTLQIEQTLYGANPKLAGCFPPGVDKGLFWQIPTVSQGEVMDRYRVKPHMMFAYTLGSLEELMVTAKILQGAGFNAYEFTGKGKQNLLTSLHYYSYYLLHFVGEGDTVVPAGDDSYPSYRQYAGQALSRANGLTIDGAEPLVNPFLLGNQAFPGDPQIKAVLAHLTSLKTSTVPLSHVASLYLDTLPAIP
jgi:hypothetical protein